MRCEHCGSEIETREIPWVDGLGRDTGRTIMGQVVGPFLVHQAAGGDPCYVVSHIASGGIVTSGHRTMLAALDIAAILAEHPEHWSFTTFEESIEPRVFLISVVREAKAKILGPVCKEKK